MYTSTGLRPYSQINKILSGILSPEEKRIPLDELEQEIIHLNFTSRSREILPREDLHIRDNPAFLALLKYYLTNNLAADKHIFNSLKIPDKEVGENNSFTFPVLRPAGKGKSQGVIFLLHGLNERSWDKYLPWASRLASVTGKAVILFPLAFHMNRAPEAWSQLRSMMAVSRERKNLLPDLEGSSFANVAISYRMQFAPQRFILSGVQTFGDILQLIQSIRQGELENIHPGASLDIFSYSIGATLAEVLLMANPLGLLSHSRAFLFCGGPVLDRASPVNRGIIDNHAFQAILHFFQDFTGGRIKELEQLESQLENNSMQYFKSLLLSEKYRRLREGRLNEIQDRIMSLTLTEDRVMTPEAVRETLAPDNSSSPILCETIDFPFPYSHENPFNPGREYSEPADEAFDRVFLKAGSFLS